jgi:hypothetical protein
MYLRMAAQFVLVNHGELPPLAFTGGLDARDVAREIGAVLDKTTPSVA